MAASSSCLQLVDLQRKALMQANPAIAMLVLVVSASSLVVAPWEPQVVLKKLLADKRHLDRQISSAMLALLLLTHSMHFVLDRPLARLEWAVR